MKSFALFLLLSLTAFAQSPNSLASRLDPIFAGIGDANSPGIAVEVIDHGKVVFELTRGVRDLKTRKPITATTDFRLASCTKQFTAMAVMLLVHDGKLRYHETMTEIYPEFPLYVRKITIQNLLNHTSGLLDYEDLMDAPENKANNWSRTHQITDAEVQALLKAAGEKPDGSGRWKFAPGTEWAYSNTGYVMLGNIVAKVSGMSFPKFLQKRIFAPLQMTHTVAYVRGKNKVPERAYGYSRGKVPDGPAATSIGWVDTDQSSTSATLGDGGIYSNLEDLAKWDAALANHTLLSAEEMKPALVPFKLPNGKFPQWSGDSGDEDPQHGRPVQYGFGWFVDPLATGMFAGHPRMWHYGDTSGFKSAIMRFPDDGVTIVILTNRTDVDPAGLAEKVAASY